MASYNDRVSNFNTMLNTTQDHVKGIAEAAKKFQQTNDPVGLGLNITQDVAGGMSTIAGGVTGIQHFKDFKTMYNGLQGTLKNGPATGASPSTPQTSGSEAAGQAQPSPAGDSNPGSLSGATQDLSEGSEVPAGTNSALLARMQGLLNQPSPLAQAQASVNAAQSSANSLETTNTGIQSLLPRTQGTGGQNVVRTTPDNSANPVAPDNNVNLAPDANAGNSAPNPSGDLVNTSQGADSDAGGLIAIGRNALSRLGIGNIQNRAGQAMQGLRNMAGDVNSQAANAGAQVQQQVGDQAQHALSGLSNPNGAGAAPGANGVGAGADGGADAAAAAAKAAATGAESELGSAGAGAAEGLSAATATEGAAAFAGPAAPIVGLIGGIIGLGTEIASAVKKPPPPPKAIAPPPAATISVGGNLKDAMSGAGGGIY